MERQAVYEILSSRTRMKIASMISTRPRSLDELSEATGISIQGVLKNLRKLQEIGLAEEIDVSGPELSVRKAYGVKAARFGDYSLNDLVIVKSSDMVQGKVDVQESLETLAEESIIRVRRVREQARRLDAAIDELRTTEDRILNSIEKADLEPDVRQILKTIFTEETTEASERLLTSHYGLRGGRRSIDKALAKAKRIVG